MKPWYIVDLMFQNQIIQTEVFGWKEGTWNGNGGLSVPYFGCHCMANSQWCIVGFLVLRYIPLNFFNIFKREVELSLGFGHFYSSTCPHVVISKIMIP